MNEIKLSSRLPPEAVAYVFEEVDAELEKNNYPPYVSIMPSKRVVAVNNDDFLFGELSAVAGMAVNDWIDENYESVGEEASELRAANTVTRHFL